MAVKYPRGTILLIAQVPDENGANPKDRPVVLVRDFQDTDALAYGVGVTSTFPSPIPPASIGLPFHRQGNCATGLTKKCVAKCQWIVVAGPADFVRKLGHTPSALLVVILQHVQAMLPPIPAP